MADEKKEIKFDQPSQVLLLANRLLGLIILIIVLAALGLGYGLVIRPVLDDISSQELSAADTQALRERNQNLLSRLQELKLEYEDIKNRRQDDLTRLQAVIPSEPQIAELFVMADELAQNHSFRLEAIDIVASKEKETSDTPVPTDQDLLRRAATGLSPSATSSPETNNPLKSLVVHMTFVRLGLEKDKEEELPSTTEPAGPSSYELFKEYLTDLERNLRLMDIQSVTFGELVEGEDAVFEVSLQTYYK